MIATPDIPEPWRVSAQVKGGLDGITLEAFKKSVERAYIGADYLIDRKENRKRISKKIQRNYR